MAKYTTRVETICETFAGKVRPEGFLTVDDIIKHSWDKIFTTKAYIFDEKYRKVICSKILKHYYMREICAETVGLWQLWMNERLEELLPYYNKMWTSELIDFNPMYNKDMTVDYEKKGNGTNTDTQTGGETTTSESDVSNLGYDKYSDTPQGALTGVDNDEYLTSARKVNNDQHSEGVVTTERNLLDNSESITTEDYLQHLVGKDGAQSYSQMLMEFRQSFVNIDMMLINDFADLFFGLY